MKGSSTEFGVDQRGAKPPATISTGNTNTFIIHNLYLPFLKNLDGIDIDDWVLSVPFLASEGEAKNSSHDVTLSIWDFAGKPLLPPPLQQFNNHLFPNRTRTVLYYTSIFLIRTITVSSCI